MYQINRIKNKNHKIILTDAEKALDKNLTHYIMKTNQAMEWCFLNLIKDI